MANTLSPTGFQSSSFISGLAQNFGLTPGKMAYNAAACYRGDALKLVTGKLAVATVTGNTGAAVVGVAESFSWLSIAQGSRVWKSYYPGSDSVGNADVDVLFQGSPEALFTIQCNGGPAVQADIGSFFNFALTQAGSVYSGMSGMTLDYASKNGTQGSLPFVLQAILQPPVADPTTQYNLVQVGIATLTRF